MAPPALVLFDDAQARSWEPFALTRPAAELRFGSATLREHASRAFGLVAVGALSAPHLADFEEPGAPGVLRPESVPRDGPVLYWCARAVPAPGTRVPWPDPPALLTLGGRPAGWLAPPGAPVPERFVHELDTAGAPAARADVPGEWLDHVWELITRAADRLARDLAAEIRGRSALPPGVHVLGDRPVEVARDARLEPGIVVDAREAPVRLGPHVEVRAFTRIEGPADFGPHSRLLGGALAGVSAGPYSYLHGEVQETTVLGYTNKAHDGYLGHAYVGRWVNLGALTTNSDLKNTYGTVRIWTPAGERDTGARKVGALIGDHVKTGIGVLLTTGCVVGAGSTLFGTTMPPRYVPPFSWGSGADGVEVRLDAFLQTAERMMARRGIPLGERGRRYLAACWEAARAARA
jgi:UDP-N-acetylglucosamine diphosphorylase/glucosamine-1-phosphate N-acetyltransferase